MSDSTKLYLVELSGTLKPDTAVVLYYFLPAVRLFWTSIHHLQVAKTHIR